MQAEQKELYTHTKNRFEKELQRISPNCVAPLIASRQVVKKAIDLYIKDCCSAETKIEDIFSEEDFQAVSRRIYDEIMKGEL
jgi:hypothetical protein